MLAQYMHGIAARIANELSCAARVCTASRQVTRPRLSHRTAAPPCAHHTTPHTTRLRLPVPPSQQERSEQGRTTVPELRADDKAVMVGEFLYEGSLLG